MHRFEADTLVPSMELAQDWVDTVALGPTCVILVFENLCSNRSCVSRMTLTPAWLAQEEYHAHVS